MAGDRRTSVAARDRSTAIGGDVVGSVLVNGNNNTFELVVGPEHGDLLELLRPGAAAVISSRPTPVLARPRPFGDHVDREGEASAVLAAAASGPVNVYGATGAGKTYLMVHTANEPAAAASADGVVFLDGGGAGCEDLLQLLFDELYESKPASKQTAAAATRYLRQKQATVFVDDFGLQAEEAQRFFLAAGDSRFVVASRDRATWQGTPVRLGGLDLASALVLTQRELGRPVRGAESHSARVVWEALDGNPLEIRRAVGAVASQGLSLEDVARRLSGAPAKDQSLDLSTASASGDERTVLAWLAVFGPAGADEALIAATTGITDDVTTVLDSLARRHLVESRPEGRYRIAGGAGGLGAIADLAAASTDATERAAAALLSLAGARRAESIAPVGEAGPMLGVLRLARRHGRHEVVIRLGRAVSATLALSRMWDSWREALDAVLVAARQVGDRAGEAWALHQLGTRSVALGFGADGARLLEKAYEIRIETGDQAGAAATSRNLAAARRAITPRRGRRWLAAAAAAMTVVASAIVLWAALTGPDPVVSGPALSVAAAGGGAGTITSSPAGIDCTATCRATFAPGTEVTLIATAATGSVFSTWEAPGCSGNSPCTVRLDGDVSATARFDATPASRTLRVAGAGSGAGRVRSEPSGIDCGATCAASFTDGAQVALTAVPDNGSRFARWETRGCAGTGTCTITLSTDVTVTAHFETVPVLVTRRLTVARSGPGAGTVRSEPSGIACGASCAASFSDGAQVALTAVPDNGSRFARWETPGCAGTGTCTITLSTDVTVTALFEKVPVTLKVAMSGQGTGTVRSAPSGINCGTDCEGDFAAGSQVTLTAAAAQRSGFVRWDAPECTGTGPCQITVDQNRTVTATFGRIWDIVVRTAGQGRGTVTPSSAGTPCTAPPPTTPGGFCAAFPEDGLVTLTATPASGSYFGGWSGACTGTSATCIMVIRPVLGGGSAATATATFHPTVD